MIGKEHASSKHGISIFLPGERGKIFQTSMMGFKLRIAARTVISLTDISSFSCFYTLISQPPRFLDVKIFIAESAAFAVISVTTMPKL